MTTTTRATSWLDEAACDPWFDTLPIAFQVATCQECPVRLACLAHAVQTRPSGVVQAGIVLSERPTDARRQIEHAARVEGIVR